MGKKYVIELEDETFEQNNDPVIPTGTNTLWRVKGFNSLVFDENGLRKLEEFKEPYSAGYDEKEMDDACSDAFFEGTLEAWGLARRLLKENWHKCVQKVFPGLPGPESVIKSMQYEEVRDKFAEWDKKISVGDVCRYKSSKREDEVFVVTRVYEDEDGLGEKCEFFDGVWGDGSGTGGFHDG